MTDNHWGSILPLKNSKEIVDQFKNSLTEKMTLLDSAAALELLQGVRSELLKEISAGRRIPAEIEKLIGQLPQSRFADELQGSRAQFLQLAGELYKARASVSSTLSHAQSFYDSIVISAFNLAAALVKTEGMEIAGLTYSLLVSGELGRAESLLGKRSGIFFIYRDVAATGQENIHELAIRFMAVLSACFPEISRNLHSHSAFWFGSAEEWRKTAAGLLAAGGTGNWAMTGGKNFALFIATAADMRAVGGDAAFGRSMLAVNKELLGASLQSSSFAQLARETATMPVALGLFGRFKTVRTGSRRGKIDLLGMALDPLTAAVRLLAIGCSNAETTLSGRIKAILAAGSIGVALADRLLIAYQDFMRERIRLELSGGNASNELFLDTEELDEATKERFRAGLENVATLQRLVHQQLVEVAPA